MVKRKLKPSVRAKQVKQAKGNTDTEPGNAIPLVLDT
jgi:hypothetical protein